LLVYAATAYAALSTADIKLDSVPFKLFVVLPALSLCLVEIARERRFHTFAFRWPVLVVGVAVPLAWFARALVLHLNHDATQQGSLHFALQEASRFVYLLLYFPIVDEMRRCRESTREMGKPSARPQSLAWLSESRVWLGPLLALAAVTIALLLAAAVLGLAITGPIVPNSGGAFSLVQGAIGRDPAGAFQVFLTTDVLLLPGFALLLVAVLLDGATFVNAGLAATLIATAYVTHARGVWLGIAIVWACGVFAVWPRSRRPFIRIAAALGLAVLAGALLLISADPLLARSAVSGVLSDPSTATRLRQAPALLAGIGRAPLIGSGLGATLPSGFARNAGSPWSFELAYLQLLFQLGVAGTLLVAWPLVEGVWLTVKGLLTSRGAADPRLLAALGGCVALTVTCASNPYLFTSAGMLTYAITLALVQVAVDHDAAVEHVSDSDAAARPREARLPARRLRLSRPAPSTTVAYAAIGGALALLAVNEFTATRQLPLPGAPVPIRAPAGGSSGPLRLAVSLPRLASGSIRLAGTWGRSGSLTAFIVTSHDGRLLVVADPLADVRARSAVRLVWAGAIPPGSLLGATTGPWRGSRALFLISQSGRRLLDEAVALDGSGRVLAQGGLALSPPGAGTRRYAAINIGPHGRPSLFVVDQRRDQLSITVRDGFPNAGRVVSSVSGRLPFAGAGAAQVVIGAVDSVGADVTLLGPAFTPSLRASGSSAHAPATGRIPIHVIPAERRFRTFGTVGTLAEMAPIGWSQAAIIYDRGAPVLVTLDPRRRALRATGLWSLTPGF
jgi:hypothetical protein